MKKIIWALFDDAESSYQQALKDNPKYEIHSIGINDKVMPNYHRIDLSITNNDLIKQLDELPRPHIIIASPPCESWSIADCGGRFVKEVSTNTITFKTYFEYLEYNTICFPTKKRDFYGKTKNFLIGVNTITATIAIIEHYKPKYYVIENPTTSLIWNYIGGVLSWVGKKNKTFYSAYDTNFSLKPTIFFSNTKLELKQERVRGNKAHMLKSSYSKRSSIPLELIRDIMKQLEINNE